MAEKPFIPGEDDAGVLELRARVWGPQHPYTSAAYYEWLFRKTPSGPGSGIVSRHDNRIVGFAGICNRTVATGNEDLRLCHGLDFMVDPSLPGALSGRVAVKIVMKHVELAKFQGYDLSINFPNERSRRMIVSGRGKFVEIIRPSLLVCPLLNFAASTATQSSAHKRIAMTVGGRLLAILGASRRTMRMASGAEILRARDFDEGFDELWFQIRRDGKLRFCRDRQALNWRYTSHPIHRYSIRSAMRSGKLQGFLVTATRELMGLPATMIVDLCFPQGAGDVAMDLISSAVQSASQDGSVILATQTTHDSSSYEPLVNSGFMVVREKWNPRPFQMTAHIFADRAKVALRRENWSFGWGDMDVV